MSSSRTGLPVEAVAVVGPTASGKTALAIALAERLGTEIISSDSMQVFAGMEIGTAAPTASERARVRHHFVSCLNPGDLFSAGEFQRQGRIVLGNINARGVPAVVAGGSGLYTSALLDGLFEGPEKNDAVRAKLEGEAAVAGAGALYARLQAVDPEYAATIDQQDTRRIVRGLEVYEISGTPLSALHREHQARAVRVQSRFVAIQYPREVLYRRINDRVDAMLAAGFLDELRALLEAGHRANLEQLRTLGYREFMAHLRGEVSFEDARAAMQQNTRRYAKRQLTWFRADDRIEWIEPDEQDAWVDRLVKETGVTA